MSDTPERRADDGAPPIPVPPPFPEATAPMGAAPAASSEADVPTASVPVITAATAPAGSAPGPQPFAAAPVNPYPAPPQPPGPGGTPPGAPPQRSSSRGIWIALAVVGGILLLGFVILVILVAVAFATARHWTKVDEPARPATFHSEEYATGNYDVTDDHVNPCSVGQDWTDCINLLVDQYNGACVGMPLTSDGQTVCTGYLSEIDTMKSEDAPGYYVSSLGDYGHLSRTPETATRQVSNHDATPAKTHTATCYLGIIGECRGMPSTGGAGTTSTARPTPASGS